MQMTICAQVPSKSSMLWLNILCLVQIQALDGGISNALLKVTPPAGDAAAAVVRLFGSGTDFFVDRAHELRIMRRAV